MATERKEIEKSWRTWLKAIAGDALAGEHGEFHVEFWDWYWPVLLSIRDTGSIPDDFESVMLAIWPRGGGKSTHAELATIAYGAIVGSGYVLYVSGTSDLAAGHMIAISEHLEGEGVKKYYPELATPKTRKNRKQQQAWSQNFLYTACGWGIRSYGLDVGVRGGKLGKQRPTLIVLDDVDELHDSPAAVQKKIERLSRSILPTAARGSLVIGVQNLIHANSVFNQIYERKVGLLSRRRISGPYPALRDLEIAQQGQIDVIVKGTPTWPAFDMKACQDFLEKHGRAAFLAEYQQDVNAATEGLVIPEFAEAVHVITWSEFARVYGRRYIPEHWAIEVGHDWGSTGPTAHPAVVSFVATSAEDSRLPGMYFLFAGITGEAGCTPREIAAKIKLILGPRREVGKTYDSFDAVKRWVMSHEAKSERDTYRREEGIPFVPWKTGPMSGLAQLRHFLRIDSEVNHPFKPKVKGASAFYWIVDDDQLEKPFDDRGLFRHRMEIKDWRWRATTLGEGGLTDERPVKFKDDAMDTLKGIAASWMPATVPLTIEQRIEERLPLQLRETYLAQMADKDKRDYMRLLRIEEIVKVRKEIEKQYGPSHWLDEAVTPPWKEERAMNDQSMLIGRA